MNKKITLTIIVVALTCCTSFAKPGGWIKDFLNNSNPQTTYVYYPQPMHCQPVRPSYYYPEPVIYIQPYYFQPQYVPVQPVQRNYYYQQQNWGYKHCR